MFNLLLNNNKRAFVSEAPVHLTLILAVAKRQLRIDSIRLGKSYLESISTSEFGATTDIRQTAGYDIWLAAVLPNSANIGPLANACQRPLILNADVQGSSGFSCLVSIS